MPRETRHVTDLVDRADAATSMAIRDARRAPSASGPFARGRVVFPLLAFLASGIVALPTVNWAFHASGGDHTTTLGLLALVGLAIAGMGAVLRACAHNRDEIDWMDHLGKLFAVGAFSYIFWDDILLIGHETWGDVAAAIALAVLGLAVVLIGGRVLWLRRAARTVAAPPRPACSGCCHCASA